MRWESGRESDNVVSGGGGFGSGRGARLPLGGFRLGLKSILIVVIISFVVGLNPLDVLSFLSGTGPMPGSYSSPAVPTNSTDPQVRFVKSVLGSTEDVWGSYFQAMGKEYERPHLELFSGYTRSACGLASEAMGPFYCPGDHKAYLDLSFFQQMEQEFQASGDFARAYVIAHEVGHHVQNILGTMSTVDRARAMGERMEGESGLSVRLELQADCYAGVWANRSQKQLQWLEAGDIESALNAANQIGDDMLAKKSQGSVMPDSFTHGTSAQRVRWFKKGFDSGDLKSCDTFN